MSPEFNKRIPAALLILRFFLGTFLLQWSIEKLILPNAAARASPWSCASFERRVRLLQLMRDCAVGTHRVGYAVGQDQF